MIFKSIVSAPARRNEKLVFSFAVAVLTACVALAGAGAGLAIWLAAR